MIYEQEGNAMETDDSNMMYQSDTMIIEQIKLEHSEEHNSDMEKPTNHEIKEEQVKEEIIGDNIKTSNKESEEKECSA